MWSIRLAISRRSYGVLALLGLLVPLLAWSLLSAYSGVNAVFLPAPGAVVTRIGTWALEDDLLGDASISTMRVVAGWALSAWELADRALTPKAVAPMLVALIDCWPSARRYVSPCHANRLFVSIGCRNYK